MFVRAIDHIVYIVDNLEQAILQFEKRLGVKPIFGGYHKTQGTKNALVNLGNNAYLELLAIDESNKKIIAPRWMGIDLMTEPQISRWAIKSDQLKTDSPILQQLNPRMGQIKDGERKMENGDMLTWQLIMPLADPEVEVIPFMVDWQSSIHPSNQLEEQCHLKTLHLSHPSPELFQPTLRALNIDLQISKGEKSSIKLEVVCPNGIVIL